MEHKEQRPEPWLRGTLTEIDAVKRQVLHALELTGEDAARWCARLSDEEMHHRPFGLASVAFHLRHIAGSLDRLLTYAEGGELTEAQLNALKMEPEPSPAAASADGQVGVELVEHSEPLLSPCLVELRGALDSAAARILLIPQTSYEQFRSVGRAHLPSTAGGLLVHCAEHTQRHSGQAIVTAKVVLAMRSAGRSAGYAAGYAKGSDAPEPFDL